MARKEQHMDTAWKKFERKIGEMLGLPQGQQREGPTGMLGFDVIAPYQWDLQGSHLGVECKHTKDEIPKWLTSAVEQSERHKAFHELEADDEKYDPLLVVGQGGMKKEEILCVLRFGSYLRLRGRAALVEAILKSIQGELKMTSRNEISLQEWRVIREKLCSLAGNGDGA